MSPTVCTPVRREAFRRWVLLAAVASIALAPALAPGTALALTLEERGELAAKGPPVLAPFAPGLRAAAIADTATPLPASPVIGTLDAAGVRDDIYSVELTAGQRFTVVLDADPGTDLDLYLYWPNAVQLGGFEIAAAGVATAYPEMLTFDAAWPGTYFLDVHASAGAGAYSFAWSLGSAIATPAIGRMWGLSRYETAAEISRHTFPDQPSHDAVIACGERFPDALTASGLAGSLGCPLLLTRKDSIPASVPLELARLGATDLHIVGGTAAVSAAVEQAFRDGGYTTYRYAGADRYQTAAEVARAVDALTLGTPRMTLLARGDTYPDALSVSAIAYQYALPVLLTRPTALSAEASAALVEVGSPRVLIAGGEIAVSSQVASEVAAMSHSPSVDRAAGTTRYGTAVEVARYAVRKYLATPSDLGVASGTGFADALSGGSSSGARGGLVLLTYGGRLADEARLLLEEYGGLGLVDDVTVYGGVRAVDESVEDEILEALQ